MEQLLNFLISHVVSHKQGSTLGPHLFLTFMNDLSFEIDDTHKLKMFADDSTTLVAGRTLEYVNQQLANCLKPISSWIGNHGMALNVAKTESMVISSRPKLERLRGQRILITHNGTAIKSVDSHKLLGLVPDEQLTWNSHTDEVGGKVLKRLYLLKPIKTYLPQYARQSFYKSNLSLITKIWFYQTS